MKKNIIRVLILLLLILIFVTSLTFYYNYASGTKYCLYLNGQKINSSQDLIIKDGTMYAPLSGIANWLCVKAEYQAKNIKLSKGSKTIYLTLNSSKIRYNEKAEDIAEPVLKINGTVWAPLKNLLKTLDTSVGWDSDTKKVYLYSQGKNVTVFFGDSLTENFNLNKYFTSVINRGKSGDTTFNAIGRLDKITMLAPGKLFIMLGTNDVWNNFNPDVTMANFRHIIKIMNISSPKTEIIIQSILPLGENAIKRNPKATNEKVQKLNKELKDLCLEFNLEFVDIGSLYKDKSGKLGASYSSDGIHINGKSYKIWANTVRSLIDENSTH